MLRTTLPPPPAPIGYETGCVRQDGMAEALQSSETNTGLQARSSLQTELSRYHLQK
jgi:hypothetical protein